VFGRLGQEARDYIDAITAGLPGVVGQRVRAWYVSRSLAACGDRLVVERGCTFVAPANIRFGHAVSCGQRGFFTADGGSIQVGDRVGFNTNVHVNASFGNRIQLGSDVLVGPNVVLRSSSHRFDRTDVPIREQGHEAGEIVIEDDVWLAANVTVLGGVRIGRGAVVAAGAVVTKDVDPFTVVGGVPARFIRKRGSPPT
jgi:galactoside O-acetyltransferase